MQYTLMPASERRLLRHEYRVRAAIVLCFALSVSGLIGIGSLFPAFVRAVSDQHDAETALAAVKKDKSASGLTQIQAQVAGYQELVTSLASVKDTVKDSSLIQSIVGARGSITLSSISVSRGTGKTILTLQGVAPTRDDLLAYKTALESAAPGSAVNLPISELAKSTDVTFSIQVTEQLP